MWEAERLAEAHNVTQTKNEAKEVNEPTKPTKKDTEEVSEPAENIHYDAEEVIETTYVIKKGAKEAIEPTQNIEKQDVEEVIETTEDIKKDTNEANESTQFVENDVEEVIETTKVIKEKDTSFPLVIVDLASPANHCVHPYDEFAPNNLPNGWFKGIVVVKRFKGAQCDKCSEARETFMHDDCQQEVLSAMLAYCWTGRRKVRPLL